jgi:pimeloyl-ACP methyl ester carboxylesterase
VAFLQAAYDSFAAACKAKYGAKLKFYSTENAARDMDLIRIAIGDEKISYLGVSYGTYLGAVYATMFPTHVRSMVLDSALNPKVTPSRNGI